MAGYGSQTDGWEYECARRTGHRASLRTGAPGWLASSLYWIVAGPGLARFSGSAVEKGACAPFVRVDQAASPSGDGALRHRAELLLAILDDEHVAAHHRLLAAVADAFGARDQQIADRGTYVMILNSEVTTGAAGRAARIGQRVVGGS